jgi:hypothetical protein
MSTAHPWLEELPWPTEKMPRNQLYERIEHTLTMVNMGVLATTGKNGPIASPVEFYAEGLTAYMYPQPGSPKLKAMQRDPRVSFAVHTPVVGWVSCRGAQLFGEAEFLEPGTPEWEHGINILRWQASAAELGRDVNVKPSDTIMRIAPDRVVYTEHWIRRQGFAPRQIWRKADT